MKKTVLSLGVILFLFNSLPAQNNSCTELYIKAMTANSPDQRARLLKDFLAQCGDRGGENANFAYASLCTMAYSGKTDKDTLDYGEKAIAMGGLDDLSMYQVLITVAGKYAELGQKTAKAKTYAMQAVNLAKAAKAKENSGASPAQWDKFIGAGYYVHGQAQEKSGDFSGAVDSYIASFNILKNKQIAASLAKVAKALYEAKEYSAAEKALRVAVPALGDNGSTLLYAKTLHRNNKKNEALKYYKQSYAKKKNGEIAYNIGIITAGNGKARPAAVDEAIQYLLEASFLSPAHSQKAMELAERLYFNKNPKYNESVKKLTQKSKNLENLTSTFNTKFGEKTEEELSDAEKKEMKDLLASIEAEQKAIEKIQSEQQAVLDSFNTLIETTKRKLGIK